MYNLMLKTTQQVTFTTKNLAVSLVEKVTEIVEALEHITKTLLSMLTTIVNHT